MVKVNPDMAKSLASSDCDPFATGEENTHTREEEELDEERRSRVVFRRNVSMMNEEVLEKSVTSNTPTCIDEETEIDTGAEEQNNLKDNIIEDNNIETEDEKDEDNNYNYKEPPFPPLRPFSTKTEIEKYEYEKKRCQVYQKHNMFYVPSYEDEPQLLPHIVSMRLPATNNDILKKSLHPESFTYNSWLSRNNYNTSSEHAHIVDEHAVSTPGHICAKPQTSTSQLILPRRVSEISIRRRPSIATKNSTQSLLKGKEYTWIEGVHIKSKESVEVCFEDFGIMRKMPEKSRHECDARLFTFKANGTKKSFKGNIETINK